MPELRLLPPHVIAKIAAGEVVERPSSVVKELIENAIDAKATSIEVHLKDAGKELIHIKDNGEGISKENLNHIFQRHATSKIKNIEDLETLLSMGFRGEALFSIAAVADVTLESQAREAPDAWIQHLRGGKRLLFEPCAAKGHGTDIKVAELFFNTPARRKFLKNNTSEINSTIHAVLNYALLYPGKRFLLTHAGRTLLDLKTAESFKDRMSAALNLNVRDLLETSQDLPPEKIRIRAVLGNINIARPRRDMQYFFINDRPIEHKSLSFAVNDVYRSILPPGIYGAFAVMITVDPASVDANIHPSKKEVRLHGEAKIISLIRHLTEYTLMQYGGTKTVIAERVPQAENISLQQRFDLNRPDAGLPLPMITDPQAIPDLFHGNEQSMSIRFQRATYIGAFLNKFLLFEEKNSLMLVDQHAAQERIMFERFSRQIEERNLEIQHLLTPLTLSLNPKERVAFDELSDKLLDLGIETTLLDDHTLAIHSQPVLLKNIIPSVRTLLAGEDISRSDRLAIARRACKASIVAGDRLNPMQVEHQRKELLACKDPFTCPHGRPIIIEITEGFIDRQFLRSS